MTASPDPDGPVDRLLLIGISLLALLHTGRYLSHFSDDAFVALRYARRLASGLGLGFNDGEWVEGYSDLGWVLSIGALNVGGVSGVDAARFLGAVGLVLGITAVARVQKQSALWIALSGAVCSWAVGGLEHALMGGIAAWAALGLRNGRGQILAPLLTLLRVDGIVLVLGLGLGAGRKGARFAILGLITWVLQFGFRLLYYGDWIPNTARAKIALTPGHWAHGLRWLAEALLTHAPLVVLAAAAAWQVRRLSPALAASVLWSLYVVFVGGDHFNGFRMFVPVIPLLALLVAEGRWPRWVVPTGLLLYLGQLWSPPIVAQTQPGWALQGVKLGGALRRGFVDTPPLLATDAAGALPYASGFPTVDMLGLNDRFLATHKPADFGSGPLHHELGDATYIAQRRPELIAFCSALGAHDPCFRAGKELVKTPFFDTFREVVVDERGLRGHYWLQTDGRFGMQRDGDQVDFGALMVSTEEHPAKAGRGGFYLDVVKGDTLYVHAVLPQGKWRLNTQGFRGPMVLHSGGPVRLMMTAVEDRVVGSLSWMKDPVLR